MYSVGLDVDTIALGKKALRFIVRKKSGIKKVLELCNGQFVGPFKLEQLKRRKYDTLFNISLLPPLNCTSVSSFWLSGFLDADGSIGILITDSITHKLKKSTRLEVDFRQKEPVLLLAIQTLFTGNFSSDKQGVHRLKITGTKNLPGLITYLDSFPLQSQKYLQYFIFRRTYCMMVNKEHLTLAGLSKIAKFKERLQQVYK
ncbi:NADH:ubiquinone dehydrogenase subunit 5 [Nowakowskiella sp. JEL0078]|nr:NADH:ubiquinone dehydrogenase subunit 5 [Nowakowskiella sp. JEL0078]